eukprot:1988375-Pyramimonas_sp.AAC.2
MMYTCITIFARRHATKATDAFREVGAGVRSRSMKTREEEVGVGGGDISRKSGPSFKPGRARQVLLASTEATHARKTSRKMSMNMRIGRRVGRHIGILVGR